MPSDIDLRDSPDAGGSLELELRRLSGVGWVSLADADGRLRVLIGLQAGAEGATVEPRVRHVLETHVDGPWDIEVVGVSPAPDPEVGDRRDPVVGIAEARLRVRLLVVLEHGGAVQVHLSHRDRRASIEVAAADGLVALAGKVVDALRDLDLPVAHRVVSLHPLPADLGAGYLVSLVDPGTGDTRRGLAGGRSAPEAVARAVLNALNRYLQPSEPGAPLVTGPADHADHADHGLRPGVDASVTGNGSSPSPNGGLSVLDGGGPGHGWSGWRVRGSASAPGPDRDPGPIPTS